MIATSGMKHRFESRRRLDESPVFAGLPGFLELFHATRVPRMSVTLVPATLDT